ncbi:hydroxymethylglutaryl-CoA lyase [Tropicibacter naphthalenivorans]|uniref:Hydroxymethylglutaryl-CoA lyase YngG n=1 Tax=Tropicibacter naphthalenivorans TaxID=441103 RepID=A0A0P1GYN2_9RHOB|nr:hydroxymethylglutaryl-CoA lyase [Tropicibacter naphthalenivorans]CUH81355.1 Hydroxymethylglutaryl-CoA lyase YngG [Tropicibacter naphthalenivorans]SMC98552.1 hydroxymethylglutaryl-CoA lyase [Tropicibacter naphthalenivorans]
MSDLPSFVHITEVGPREGFQFEPPSIQTKDKIRLIDALSETGVPEIECASFANRKVVPQMADALDIAAGITRRSGVVYGSMWLNAKGFLQALDSGLYTPALTFGSASDSFLARNNNTTPDQQIDRQRKLRALYSEHGLGSGPLYLFTAFGCNYEGVIPVEKALHRLSELVAVCEEAGAPPANITLCDTIGAAGPSDVRALVSAVRDRWEYPVALHLHDTRELGIANAMAGLELGVARFDASVGGLGGCPFAGHKSAAGNVATEELALLCDRLGIETGIDIPALTRAAKLAADIVGHPLTSKLALAGVFNRSPEA